MDGHRYAIACQQLFGMGIGSDSVDSVCVEQVCGRDSLILIKCFYDRDRLMLYGVCEARVVRQDVLNDHTSALISRLEILNIACCRSLHLNF